MNAPSPDRESPSKVSSLVTRLRRRIPTNWGQPLLLVLLVGTVTIGWFWLTNSSELESISLLDEATREKATSGSWDIQATVRLREDDQLVFRYDVKCDTGVELSRQDPTTGETKWKTTCEALGVAHSKYTHTVAVHGIGDRLRVTSHGVGFLGEGVFVEWLDLQTGKQIKRNLRHPGRPGKLSKL